MAETFRNAVHVHKKDVEWVVLGLKKGDYAVTPGKDKNHRYIHANGEVFNQILRRVKNG